MFTFIFVISLILSIFGFASIFQKQALLPDLYAHTAFPGIVFAYVLFGIDNFFMLTVGALFTVYLFRFFYNSIVQSSRFSSDNALASTISGGFALGILGVNVLQNLGIKTKFDFSGFLFGNISAISQDELFNLTIFALFLVCLGFFLRNVLSVFIFDKEFLFLRSKSFYHIFKFLFELVLILLVVICLKVSGVVLTTGLFLIPVSIAMFNVTSFKSILLRLVFLCGFVSFVGLNISQYYSGVSTGPVLVLLYFFVFIAQRISYYLSNLKMWNR